MNYKLDERCFFLLLSFAAFFSAACRQSCFGSMTRKVAKFTTGLSESFEVGSFIIKVGGYLPTFIEESKKYASRRGGEW